MTCNSCVANVQKKLTSIPGVLNAEVTLVPPMAKIESKMEISTQTFRNALASIGNYDAISLKDQKAIDIPAEEGTKTSFKPLLIIGTYLILVSSISVYGNFSIHEWMRIFMASFFLTFSFFKMLDVKAFAGAYKMYDIPARYIPGYAYLYPFIELSLGILYALNVSPFYTSLATLIIMSASIAGVIQSVIDKKKIRCACLGSVFNLPMTTVTIVEDALMILMALLMIL